MQPSRSDVFRSDLGLVQKAVRSGVTEKYANKKDAHWRLWHTFCLQENVDPFLKTFDDPVPILQVFGQRYRDGRIAPCGRTVRSSTVSDAIRSVGQMHARMGTKDPRLDSSGKVDYRISQQLRSWAKVDDPPTRVRPVPVTLVMYLLTMAYASEVFSVSIAEKAFADVITMAFFFLLRPGEYTGTTSDDAAFTLDDVCFHLGNRRLNNRTAPDHEIEAATAVSLTFTTQKNMSRGDIISHARSGHFRCCPVTSIIRLFLRHRRWFAQQQKPFDGKAPLASYYNLQQKHIRVRATDITSQLRFAASLCEHATGIPPENISARSLRAGGAMALLCGRIDKDTIKLLGRWHSDAMMRYLHQEAQPIYQRLSKTMFNNGTYSFNATDTVPIRVGG